MIAHSVVIDFLHRTGLVSPTETPRLFALEGGVASDIWKVESGARTFAVKRALSRLRVAQEWNAPISRNASEVDWMASAGAIIPGAVPRILAHDADLGIFAMDYFEPERFPVWKAELANGRVDVSFAGRVGTTIAAVHGATAFDSEAKRKFSNDEVFYSIRLEPYLEATAKRHPDLSSHLMQLSQNTLGTKIALVHGDVSPKNILVGPEGPVLLDAECAWFGDPAFDLAFCLNHLLLKCVWITSATDRFLAAFDVLASAYLKQVTWEPRDVIEKRAARLLSALLLARIDGKSPVEYITHETKKSGVRRLARDFITSGAAHFEEIRTAWSRAYQHD